MNSMVQFLKVIYLLLCKYILVYNICFRIIRMIKFEVNMKFIIMHFFSCLPINENLYCPK